MWFQRFFESLRSALGGTNKAAAMAIRPGETDVLVVGIGNPGTRYDGTRHNAGYLVIDALVRVLENVRRGRHSRSEVVAGTSPEGGRILAVKPLTYVNLSGEAVGGLLRAAGLPPDRCLVVVDDFHLALGTLRLRPAGSDGGHNGLKSIGSAIGTGFPRLRVGIGPVPAGASTVDFVLSKFTDAEAKSMASASARAAEAVRAFCSRGIASAMNAYNR